MSEVTKPDRTVDTVTAEIQYIQQQVKKIFYDAVVQIGTRLLEVKEIPSAADLSERCPIR